MSSTPHTTETADFAAIAQLIVSARQRAVQAVNTSLIELYWQIGEKISRKIAAAEWGDGVVDQLARYLAQTHPGLRGFTRRNLFRMKQFYEAYPGEAIVSALLTQLPWTHHLIILGQSKRPEAASVFRDSYLVEFLDLPQGHAEADLHRDVKKPHEGPAIGVLLRAKLHEFYLQNTQAWNAPTTPSA